MTDQQLLSRLSVGVALLGLFAMAACNSGQQRSVPKGKSQCGFESGQRVELEGVVKAWTEEAWTRHWTKQGTLVEFAPDCECLVDWVTVPEAWVGKRVVVQGIAEHRDAWNPPPQKKGEIPLQAPTYPLPARWEIVKGAIDLAK